MGSHNVLCIGVHYILMLENLSNLKMQLYGLEMETPGSFCS